MYENYLTLLSNIGSGCIFKSNKSLLRPADGNPQDNSMASLSLLHANLSAILFCTLLIFFQNRGLAALHYPCLLPLQAEASCKV